MPPALFAAVIAAFWWRRAPSVGTLALVTVTTAMLVAAVVLPRIYAPVQAAFEWLGTLIARALTLILLGLVFVVVFVPGRLVLAVARRDPLQRRPDPGRTTYWLPSDSRVEADRFRHQF